jgi:hypothetical protein
MLIEIKTQRNSGYASYIESSYPVAGGVAAIIDTERSSVRLMIRRAIRIRNTGFRAGMRKNFKGIHPDKEDVPILSKFHALFYLPFAGTRLFYLYQYSVKPYLLIFSDNVLNTGLFHMNQPAFFPRFSGSGNPAPVRPVPLHTARWLHVPQI